MIVTFGSGLATHVPASAAGGGGGAPRRPCGGGGRRAVGGELDGRPGVGGQRRGELGRELVLRLELRHLGELGGGRLLVPLDEVEVGEQELGRRRRRVLLDVRLQGPEVVGVGVHARVEAHQGGPVPARPGREHGVLDRRGLVVPPQREQGEAAELVQHRVFGQHGERLVGQGQRPAVIAGLEAVAGRLEDLLGRLRRGGLGGRGGDVDGFGVVVGHHLLRRRYHPAVDRDGHGLLHHDDLGGRRDVRVGVARVHPVGRHGVQPPAPVDRGAPGRRVIAQAAVGVGRLEQGVEPPGGQRARAEPGPEVAGAPVIPVAPVGAAPARPVVVVIDGRPAVAIPAAAAVASPVVPAPVAPSPVAPPQFPPPLPPSSRRRPSRGDSRWCWSCC